MRLRWDCCGDCRVDISLRLMLWRALRAVSLTMADLPGAAAPAAASAEAEATLRARAAAALAGSGSSSGAPGVNAALPSDDLAT